MANFPLFSPREGTKTGLVGRWRECSDYGDPTSWQIAVYLRNRRMRHRDLRLPATRFPKPVSANGTECTCPQKHPLDTRRLLLMLRPHASFRDALRVLIAAMTDLATHLRIASRNRFQYLSKWNSKVRGIWRHSKRVWDALNEEGFSQVATELDGQVAEPEGVD